MKYRPWFDPEWRAIYAAQMRRILALEALAKRAGRRIRP